MPQGANERIEQNTSSYNDLSVRGRLLVRDQVRCRWGSAEFDVFGVVCVGGAA